MWLLNATRRLTLSSDWSVRASWPRRHRIQQQQQHRVSTVLAAPLLLSSLSAWLLELRRLMSQSLAASSQVAVQLRVWSICRVAPCRDVVHGARRNSHSAQFVWETVVEAFHSRLRFVNRVFACSRDQRDRIVAFSGVILPPSRWRLGETAHRSRVERSKLSPLAMASPGCYGS